jgi:hypothetical protein
MVSAASRGICPNRGMVAEHFAAKPLGVAALARILARVVGLRDDHLAAAERPGGVLLRRQAGRDLDPELGLERADHRLRIVMAARQVDRHPAEHDDIDAGSGHLARRPHAELIGLIDLGLVAFDDAQGRQHQRHPAGDDPVEFIGENLGHQRRRGVADARPIAVDLVARRWLQSHGCDLNLGTAPAF